MTSFLNPLAGAGHLCSVNGLCAGEGGMDERLNKASEEIRGVWGAQHISSPLEGPCFKKTHKGAQLPPFDWEGEESWGDAR